MKQQDLCKQFLVLLFLLLFMALSKAQDSLPSAHPMMVKTQGTSPYANVHCALQDKAGNLWFGTTGEGAYRYDGHLFTNFTADNGLCSNDVLSILEDKDGNIWFGTSQGACYYNGKTFAHALTPEALADASQPVQEDNTTPHPKLEIYSIFQDKAGSFWFGTGDRGVYRYDGKTFTRFLNNESITNKNGLRLNAIEAIVEDRAGNIWFASWNQEGVSRYDGKTLTQFTAAEGLMDGMIHCIFMDKAGNLWFGARNSGVYRFDGKSFVNITEQESLGRHVVYEILEDKNGNLWFATEGSSGGAWRYDGKSFTPFTTKDGLGNNSVVSLVEDASGNIWFGTRGMGLSRYDGKGFKEFVKQESGN